MRPTQLEIGTHDEGLAECGVLLDPRCEGCIYAHFCGFWVCFRMEAFYESRTQAYLDFENNNLSRERDASIDFDAHCALACKTLHHAIMALSSGEP